MAALHGLDEEIQVTTEAVEEDFGEPDELSNLLGCSNSNDGDMQIWTSTLPWVSTNFQNILGSMSEGAIEYRPIRRVFITAEDIEKVNKELLRQELARRGLQVEITICQGQIRRCSVLSDKAPINTKSSDGSIE